MGEKAVISWETTSTYNALPNPKVSLYIFMSINSLCHKHMFVINDYLFIINNFFKHCTKKDSYAQGYAGSVKDLTWWANLEWVELRRSSGRSWRLPWTLWRSISCHSFVWTRIVPSLLVPPSTSADVHGATKPHLMLLKQMQGGRTDTGIPEREQHIRWTGCCDGNLWERWLPHLWDFSADVQTDPPKNFLADAAIFAKQFTKETANQATATFLNVILPIHSL